MNALTLLTAFLTLHSAGARQNLSIDIYRMTGGNKVLVKNGDSLTGEVQFRAVIQTTHPIQAVEFYVGDDLRESDGSTPYEFKLDTLSEADGNIKVRFKGFTTEGQNVEKTFTLVVDNGINKGADYHVAKGNSLLTEGKYDEAITEGRIAQQADKASLGARILLARANFAKGLYDKAQKFAEDALELDKNSREAKEVIISLKVQQAFNAVSRDSNDRKEIIDSIKKGLAEAIKYRVALLNEDVDRLSAKPSSLEYLDAAIRARRYSLVIDALAPQLKSNFKNNDLNNRLAFAYLMTNQVTGAEDVLRNVKKFGEYDGYGFALSSIVATERGTDTVADDMIKEALLNAPDSLGLKSAQAFIALKRNNPRSLTDAANALLKENETRSESYYFAAALSNRLKRIDMGRKYFERALKYDAADHDMYVEQGNEAISLALTVGLPGKDKDFQLDYAHAMFDLALMCRDNSAQALAGISIACMFQKKADEALSYAEASTKAGPSYAAGWYTYAAALSYKRVDARAAVAKAQDPATISKIKAQEQEYAKTQAIAFTRAQELDARNLKGRAMPDSTLVFNYYNTTGRTPVISVPSRG